MLEGVGGMGNTPVGPKLLPFLELQQGKKSATHAAIQLVLDLLQGLLPVTDELVHALQNLVARHAAPWFAAASVLACLPWSARADGPLGADVGTTLTLCQSDLSFPGDPAESTVSKRLGACGDALDAVLDSWDRLNPPHLGRGDKQTLLTLAQGLLYQVRSLQTELEGRPLRERTHLPLLSQTVAVEGKTRRILSRIHDVSTWSWSAEAAGGLLLGARNPVPWTRWTTGSVFDQGTLYDAVVELVLTSPLESPWGLVGGSTDDPSVFTLSKAYLRWKRFPHIELWLGTFPEPGLLGESIDWPFTSAAALLTFFPLDTVRLSLRLREDTLGLLPRGLFPAEALLLERFTSEASLSSNSEAWVSPTSGWELGSRLHWFTDPAYALGSLSLGRPWTLPGAAGDPYQAYRVVQLFGHTWAARKPGVLTAFASGWRNLRAREPREAAGYAAGGRLALRLGPWSADVLLYQAGVGAQSIPPLLLPPWFLPRSKAVGALVRGTRTLRKGLAASLWVSGASPVPRDPILPRFALGGSIFWSFPSDYVTLDETLPNP